MKTQLILVLIAMCVSLGSGAVLGPDSLNQELFVYQQNIYATHQLLKAECSESVRLRREVYDDSTIPLHLEVAKSVYGKLIETLMKCRANKLAKTTTTPPTTTTTATTTPTTTPKPPKKASSTTTTAPTTTTTTTTPAIVNLPPIECQSAVNFSESWRRDYNGRGIQPRNGYANCDTIPLLQAGWPWFRFSGDAGSRLLNFCPATTGSCGTHGAMWSNESMPQEVGVLAAITVYGSWQNDCTEFSYLISVMRCSTTDFVYKYTTDTHCDRGFCGMA